MKTFSQRILDWYALHARRLPWRGSPDPYAIWVSEIMLQQTRVETVIPYFNHWMQRFPSIESLATALEGEVLKVWEGLGYYSRARNLHKAAKIIRDEYGGILPSNLASLRKLPGVGRYTAGAIASMAFGLDVPSLDGNIRRVFARVFGITQPADSPEGEKTLWKLAEQNLPKGRAGDYNQALMDLGALVCLPKNPDCRVCPVSRLCQARRQGRQESLPVLKRKLPIPHYTVTAAVIRQDGKVLLAKRPSKGLLGGMWEFPGGKTEPGETLQEGLRREIREELGAEIKIGEPFGIYRHAYTHFRIRVHAFLCELTDGVPHPIEADELAWVNPTDLADYPMGKVDRLIARKLAALDVE